MVNEGNEQNSTPEPETAGTGAAPTRSAEKLTRDELAGVARADAAAGYPEYDIAGRYNPPLSSNRARPGISAEAPSISSNNPTARRAFSNLPATESKILR